MTTNPPTPTLGLGCLVRQAVNISLGILVAWLSVPVVINLLSSRQVMNTSFNPLRIVNTYGAFGRYGPSILAGHWAPPFCPSQHTLRKHELKAAPSPPGGKVDTVDSLAAFISSSITKERTEVILQGTASPNASAPDAVWEDYEFKCKPGDPWRRPCLISPYHYRLDWLMWFAAFQVPILRLLFAKGAKTPTKRVIEERDLSSESHTTQGTEQALP